MAKRKIKKHSAKVAARKATALAAKIEWMGKKGARDLRAAIKRISKKEKG